MGARRTRFRAGLALVPAAVVGAAMAAETPTANGGLAEAGAAMAAETPASEAATAEAGAAMAAETPASEAATAEAGAAMAAGPQAAEAPTAAAVAEAPATQAPRAALRVAPFSAHYLAEWKAINIGSSDLTLVQGGEPGHYMYTWTITARGIFRLYRAEVTQKSWVRINADHARPDKYSASDGSSTVNLDFDWHSRRARGTSEQKPVDLALKEGTQDLMSIQIEVMLDLERGTVPKTFQIIDKDQVKEFMYSVEGRPKLKTALGELDTIVVASQRAGNNRILKMWFAPALGYVPVQAERSRDGKLEFAMRIQRLQR